MVALLNRWAYDFDLLSLLRYLVLLCSRSCGDRVVISLKLIVLFNCVVDRRFFGLYVRCDEVYRVSARLLLIVVDIRG